ncbi:3886_t:CDS:2, partial [Ambispora gerdemannii]
IKKAITSPEKYEEKDKPVSKLTEAELKEAFGGNVDDITLGWKIRLKIEEAANEKAGKDLMKAEKKGTGDDEEKLDMTQYGASEKDGEPSKEEQGENKTEEGEKDEENE